VSRIEEAERIISREALRGRPLSEEFAAELRTVARRKGEDAEPLWRTRLREAGAEGEELVEAMTGDGGDDLSRAASSAERDEPEWRRFLRESGEDGAAVVESMAPTRGSSGNAIYDGFIANLHSKAAA
jgi:hypothetical protein